MNLKTIFVIIISFLFLNLNAQFSPKIKGRAGFSRFMKSKTYFVLSDNKTLNEEYIKGVEENWTITDYHFIYEDSLQYYSIDPKKSFVYFEFLKRKGNDKRMKALTLVNGGTFERAKYITNSLAYISIDSDGYEANDIDISFRINNMIFQLNDAAKLLYDNNFVEKNEGNLYKKLAQIYNSRCSVLQEKTLLVDKRYLNQKIVSESEFLKLYKYNVEFVDKTTIEKAIKDKDETKAYLISALNLFKINTVTDCSTGEIVYIEFEEEDKITKDFERIMGRDDILQLVEIVGSSK